MDSADLLQRLWVATLALTAAILVVALLRSIWRRAFGAEQACRLWWLPPLALVVSQLPHPLETPLVVQVPPIPDVQTVMAQGAVTTATQVTDWRGVMLVIWLAVTMACVSWAAWRQWRFMRRLRHAAVLSAEADLPRVLQLASMLGGPALVGAWRPCIVVPADFAQRYSADEQMLILAHEHMHARRRDGLACAVSTALQAVFWFHPLVWWAARRFRRDQELACDAAVLRQHPEARHSYALAMCKTQTVALALPVGCPWLGGHPVKERIAMLKFPLPQKYRRAVGHAAFTLIVAGASLVVYAARQSAPLYHPTKAMVQEGFSWVDGAKTAVAAYMFKHSGQTPPNNEQAGMDPAESITGDAVKSLTIRPGGVIDVRLRDGTGHDAGNLVLTASANASKGTISYACTSPNIPDIQSLEASCRFQPAQAVARSATRAGTQFQMDIGVDVSADASAARHAERADMALCTRSGKPASATVGNLSLDALLQALPDDKVSIAFTVAQQDVAQPSKMRIVGRLGQPMRVAISGDRSVTIDVTSSKGCPAAKSAS